MLHGRQPFCLIVNEIQLGLDLVTVFASVECAIGHSCRQWFEKLIAHLWEHVFIEGWLPTIRWMENGWGAVLIDGRHGAGIRLRVGARFYVFRARAL